jgi:hypothetical protein
MKKGWVKEHRQQKMASEFISYFIVPEIKHTFE